MIIRGSVVITGASTGIGEECAKRLASEGFDVFAGVRRDEDARRLAAVSDRVTPIRIDVTDAPGIAAAVAQVEARTGPGGIAGLINNAGIAIPGPLEYLPVADLRDQFEVNVIGAIAVTQAFLPLVRQGRGRLVFIGSIAGRMSVPFLGAYGASKFALRALCDSLRGELAPWGLHVALIEPGQVVTRIWEKGQAFGQHLRQRLPAVALQRYERSIAAVEVIAEKAARRGARPSVVADALVHALTSPSPRARYLVGGDAKVRAWVALLPDRLRDRLVWWGMGLPRDGQ